MPSGKTHDRLTWIFAPAVLLVGWVLSQQLAVSATAALAFVFAGLMFSGDLDLKSVQYKRWGWLRWIWIPYQRTVPHRSPFSHGPVLGTLTRLLYLSAWMFLLFWLWTRLVLWLAQMSLAEQSFVAVRQLLQTLQGRPDLLVASLSGLWLGALSHTLADETLSCWKRWRRKLSGGKSKKTRPGNRRSVHRKPAKR